MGGIKQEILKALAFYDIFKYPLTALEIHRNLGVAAWFGEIYGALEESKNESRIILRSGYFFLPGNENLAEKRKARFLISFRKLQKAKILARVFSYFPFVHFVGVCNSLGIFNARDESDIDFFIIARRGRIWTARFLTTLFLMIFNLRPTSRGARDKFCLSFYVADDALDISRAVLPGGDPYFYHWMGWIAPLYDGGVWRKFILENSWIKNHLPNFFSQDAAKISGRPILKRLAEKLFFIPENFFRRVQFWAMPRELKDAAGRGDGSVVIDDKMLKFHLLDRRAEYKKNYELLITNYELQ